MIPTQPTCSTCRHWQRGIRRTILVGTRTETIEAAGTCRRYPPQPNGGWVRTEADDGCGEHRPLQPVLEGAPKAASAGAANTLPLNLDTEPARPESTGASADPAGAPGASEGEARPGAGTPSSRKRRAGPRPS